MRVIRSLAPPSGALQRRPLQPRLLWLAGVFPGGSFHLPPPRLLRRRATDHTSASPRGRFCQSGWGNPRSPTPRPPAIELRLGRPMNCCSSGRTRRGRGRITARLPPIIWVELDRPQGSGFHCRSYARGRALENVGGALPCLGFPLSGGDGPTLVGGPPSFSFPCSRPPLTLIRGGGGARGRGVPC